MTRTITAVYEGGLFKPLESLELPEHTKVRLTIEIEAEASTRAQMILELARQSCEGLSEEQMATLEATRLDVTRFFSRSAQAS
jgi:predicted DNA-binding antitoxin AbrB/MazE fold protein